MAGLASRPRDAASEREDGARQLRRREVFVRRHDLDLLQARREVLRQHRRPRRQARRLRAEVRLRRRAAAAVPDRVSRRPDAGALDRLGRAAEERRRAALVPSLSRREGDAQGPAALDEAEPELELHVRGLPLDQPAQGLRRSRQSLQDDLVGGERRLRGVSRAGLEPRRVGEEGRRLEAPRRVRQGPRRRPRRAPGRVVGDERRDRQREPQPAARDGAGDRGLRPLPRAPVPDFGRVRSRPPDGRHAHRLPDRERPVLARRPDARRGLQPRLVRAEQDVREGRDLQRLPRPALAEAARAGQRRLRAVPSAVEVRRAGAPSSPGRVEGCGVRGVPHADHDLHGRRPAARPQHAHPAAGSVGRSSARRMRARIAMPTGRRNGRPTRCSSGWDARPAATRRSAKPSPRRCATPRMRGRSS